LLDYGKKYGGYKETSARTKASVGKKIVKDGMGESALMVISKAKRVDKETRSAAEKHLNNYYLKGK
jgi:hypothetical protein